jgi:hypothetical protein
MPNMSKYWSLNYLNSSYNRRNNSLHYFSIKFSATKPKKKQTIDSLNQNSHKLFLSYNDS